jgi:hypothetical protein
MAVDKIGRTFKRKSLTYGIIWTVVGVFTLYTLYAVGKPYWKAYFFKKEAHEIATTEVLGGRFYDDELVADILDAAQFNKVFCKASDIDIIEQGRRRQVDIRFSVTFEYFTYRGLWYFKTRCVGWEDVGRPVYK